MRRRFFWVTLVLLTLGGVLVGLRSCSNSALQAYVTELRSHGERLTWPELAASYSASPAGWVTEFTNQVAALGPSPVANPEKLHLAEFIEPNLARVTWSVSQLPWASADANQTNLSWLGLSRQLAAARPALRQLQEILRRPGLNSGPPTNYFDFRSLWQEMKSAAGWLACDTLVGLREDRQDDALASLRAIAGLAAMLRQDCTLVQQMSRVAVANVGLDLTWEALQAEGWSEEQLSALQACWEQCDLIAAVELALLGERTLPLECLQMIRERPKSVPGFSGFTKPTWPFNRGFHSYYRNVALPNDALYGLPYLQREVELIRQLRAGRPYHEVMVVFGEQEAALETKAKSVTRILYPISLICLPAYVFRILGIAPSIFEQSHDLLAFTLSAS